MLLPVGVLCVLDGLDGFGIHYLMATLDLIIENVVAGLWVMGDFVAVSQSVSYKPVHSLYGALST